MVRQELHPQDQPDRSRWATVYSRNNVHREWQFDRERSIPLIVVRISIP